MIRSFTILFFLAVAVASAAAQPVGPGPSPNPWVVNGPQIYYNGGCVTVPSTVSGGCKGLGTINATALYINGSMLSSSSISGGSTGNLAYYAASGSALSPFVLGANVPAALQSALNGSGGLVSIASTLPSTFTSSSLTSFGPQSANSVLGNSTASSVGPIAQAMPSCSTSTSAIIWTTNTGFGCHSITAGSAAAGTLTGTTLAGNVVNASITNDTLGVGSSQVLTVGSANTGFSNQVVVSNSGTSTNFGTTVLTGATLGCSSCDVEFGVNGGTSPFPQGVLYSDSGVTDGLSITSLSGNIIISAASALNLNGVTGVFAPTPSFGTNNTQVATMAALQSAISGVGSPLIAATNAALKATSISGLPAGTTASRRGFTAAGDSPEVIYALSTSACPLNSGAGDNGSQVAPNTGTGCWIWNPPMGGVPPTVFGAAGTANTLGSSAPDDAAAINAAVLATGTAGIPLWFDTTHLYKILSAINMNTPSDLEGPYRPGGAWTLMDCSWGIINYDTGINGINFSAVTGTINGICIDMGGAAITQPTSGIAINVAPTSSSIYQSGNRITNNGIVNTWDAIDVNGFGYNGGVCCGAGTASNGVLVAWNTIHFPANVGISNGKNTAGASTVGITYLDNTINCDSNVGGSPVKGTGFALYDGGITYDGTNNGPEGCNIGFMVAPGEVSGVGQNAQLVQHGVFGDQSTVHDLQIEPTTGGIIDFIQSDSGWTGSTGNYISAYVNCNVSGASCQEITFSNLIAHGGSGNTGPVMDVEAGASGPYDLTITGSNICQFGTPGSGSIALKLNITNQADAVGRYVITGNRLGTGCPGGSNSVGISLIIGGAPTYPGGSVTIVGNDISAATTPISYSPSVDDYVIIADNMGVDTVTGSIASAATITVPATAGQYGITGTTNISTINGGYVNRHVHLIVESGLSFITGGNVCNAANVVKGVGSPAEIYWNAGNSCWNIL